MANTTTDNLKWVAITAVIAIAAAVTVGTGLLNEVGGDRIEIADSSLKKGATTDAVFVVSVRNLGNGPISNINGNITGLPKDITGLKDGVYPFKVPGKSLAAGESASVSGVIPKTKVLSTGTSYPISVNATSSDGNVLFAIGVIRLGGI